METFIDRIAYIQREMEQQFMADNRPWVVAWSGGKDSSFVLHLVLAMLMKFKAMNIETKKVYVMSSDTGVEMPIIEAYHFNKISSVKDFVEREGLNVEVKLVKPEPEDSFLVCLLGKGYPSPNRQFRWCTDRLKIRPTETYLQSIIDKNQSIIMVLGVRIEESVARAESIEKRELNSRNLTVHEHMPNAYCYMPIKDLAVADLWSFLTTENPPYGTHEDMIALYDIGSGEADCNIIMNPNSESCGKTRFGCWVCTVVEKDSSMEGAIKNGNTWMQPFLDFRNKIFQYRYDHSKRRDKNRYGMDIPGAFLLTVREELLIDLLELEIALKDKIISILGKEHILTNEQLLLINKSWKRDGDFSNKVLKIANKYGRNFEIEESKMEKELVDICEEIDLDPLFFEELLNVGFKYSDSLRRIGVSNEEMTLIDQYAQRGLHKEGINYEN